MKAALTGGEIDTLVALVESGPVWDGDVPSKRGRDELIARGFAVRCVVRLEDGFTAATYAGRDAYKAQFGGDGTMKEAQAMRLARRSLNDIAARKP